MNRWRAGALVLAVGLLAGCAPAEPSPPGLGGSEPDEPVGIAAPGEQRPADAQELQIVPWARPHGFRITFDASRLPRGTAASLRIRDFNCMEGAINGDLDLSAPKQFLVELDQGTTCWFGTRSTSWITWDFTVTPPGGAAKTSTFELVFHHTGGGATTTSCWGEGGLACTQVGDAERVSEGNWTVEYFTQALRLA